MTAADGAQQARRPGHGIAVLNQVQPGAGLEAAQAGEQQRPLLLPEGACLVKQLHGAGHAQGLRQQADRDQQGAQIQQSPCRAQQGGVRQQGAVAEQPPVGPPQQPQRPPAAGGVGAGVEVGREPQPADQERQGPAAGTAGPQPGPPQQPKGQGQQPGGAVVGAAGGQVIDGECIECAGWNRSLPPGGPTNRQNGETARLAQR